MEHNVILQAYDNNGNMHTWQYYTIKDYLVNENHVHNDRNWRFYKAIVNGHELVNKEDGEIAVDHFRDVSDFKIYCRQNIDRKIVTMPVSKDILRQFLFEIHPETRNRIYQSIQDGNGIDDYFINGGAGKCEYRPGYISGWDCGNAKVRIDWINEDADVCSGEVSRNLILAEIKQLINEGIYCTLQPEIKPRIEFYKDGQQLPGQISIDDWLAV